MNKLDIPNSVFFTSKHQQNFLELSFKQEDCKWVTEKSFKRNQWILNVCPWLRPFMSWKTYPYTWTSWLWNSGSILHLYLSVCWYGMGCLSITVWLTCNDIHYFCCRHLWRRRALFRDDCIGSRVVFYIVTSDHNSSFPLLKLVVLTPHFWDDRCPSM